LWRKFRDFWHGNGGNSWDGRLRLVTNLMYVPAELIAETYCLRWLIELFFRMLKQLLGCRKLLSSKPGNVENSRAIVRDIGVTGKRSIATGIAN